jgi:CMD domain protein
MEQKQVALDDRERADGDVINQVAGILPGTPVAELRQRRAEVAQFIQGSYTTLFHPSDAGGLSNSERGLVALRVTGLTANRPLGLHYRAMLAQLGVASATIMAVEQFPKSRTLSPRLTALLRHVDQLSQAPGAATPAHLAGLQAHGFETRDLVTLAQLVAFLHFQVRVLAGVQTFTEAT